MTDTGSDEFDRRFREAQDRVRPAMRRKPQPAGRTVKPRAIMFGAVPMHFDNCRGLQRYRDGRDETIIRLRWVSPDSRETETLWSGREPPSERERTEIARQVHSLNCDWVARQRTDTLDNTAERDNGGERQQPPLQWLDMSHWDNEPVPQRKWAILNRVPLNQAGLFSGEGGTGKSIIEMSKDVAHVTGKDWLRSLPMPGPAIYLAAEDDRDEIHIRFAAIAKHYGVAFKDLIDGGLHVLCLLGQDATLCAAGGKSGKVETTDLYRQLYEAAGDIKPKNISIDTLSRAFAGSEIDRAQVYTFAMHMQALALVAGGSVTVLSHPSLQGMASGSGISGSTAWHGAFRFRQYLTGIKPSDGDQPDNDIREIQFLKNQYGPRADSIVLRYQHGLFLPEAGAGTLDQIAREQAAQDLFLTLLDAFGRQGRNVSDKQSPSYAPMLFAKDPDAKKAGVTKKALEAAMARLFNDGKIRVQTYGRPSRPYTRLVRV